MWTLKYRPKSFEEFVGNTSIIEVLRKYDWKKPAILHGPSGTGKSLLVELLAKEKELSIAYLDNDNASDWQNIVGTRSLFGDDRLIVIDNADQIRETKKLEDAIGKSQNPVLIITSDISSKKLSNLKRKSEQFQMRRPPAASIAKLFARICAGEGIEASADVLKKIAENSAGDLRAAVNDLEAVARGKARLEEKDAQVLESRDSSADIYNFLSAVLVKKDIKAASSMVYDLGEQPENVMLWIDENLPAVVKGPSELQKCYGYLSRTDIFMGRITSRQYWGFLRYSNMLMTAGIIASKGDKINFAKYQFPFYIIRMGQTRKERNLKKGIGQKLSGEYHCSSKTIASDYIPLIRRLVEKGSVDLKEFSSKYELDDEEAAYLEKA